MAKYALVGPGDVIHTEKDERRIDLTAGTKDGYTWRVVENVTDDQSTQAARDAGNTITLPMVETIEPARVLRTTVIRDMTAQEISDRDDNIAQSLVDQAQWKAIFIALNEGRTANGKQPITRAQMISWIKDQL